MLRVQCLLYVIVSAIVALLLHCCETAGIVYAITHVDVCCAGGITPTAVVIDLTSVSCWIELLYYTARYAAASNLLRLL